MNTKLKIILIDNCVAGRQIVYDALIHSSLDLEIEQVDRVDSAIALPNFLQCNCIFLADAVIGDNCVTQLQTAGVNAPIVLLTENCDLLTMTINELRDFGVIDVVALSEINPLGMIRIIRNAIYIYQSEQSAEHLRRELHDRQAQIIHQSQVIATQRQQINQKNIELIAAFQLKSQFLSTISHELRTPMHAVQGFSELLLRMLDHKISAPQREIIERIHHNSQKLLILLNEILDFGKLEAGTLDLQPQFFDLSIAVNSTIEEVTSLAQAKKLELRVKNNLRNTIIYNDQIRIRQIIINLLSNAIKFTDTGRVWIELEELPAEGLAIIVHDTGIGIETSEVENIFDVFRQLDARLSRKYAGTGMGLAIVNALVYMMQGRIIVSSEPGLGSTFRIEIPRQIPTNISGNALSETQKLNAITTHQANYSQQDVLLLPKQRAW